MSLVNSVSFRVVGQPTLFRSDAAGLQDTSIMPSGNPIEYSVVVDAINLSPSNSIVNFDFGNSTGSLTMENGIINLVFGAASFSFTVVYPGNTATGSNSFLMPDSVSSAASQLDSAYSFYTLISNIPFFSKNYNIERFPGPTIVRITAKVNSSFYDLTVTSGSGWNLPTPATSAVLAFQNVITNPIFQFRVVCEVYTKEEPDTRRHLAGQGVDWQGGIYLGAGVSRLVARYVKPMFNPNERVVFDVAGALDNYLSSTPTRPEPDNESTHIWNAPRQSIFYFCRFYIQAIENGVFTSAEIVDWENVDTVDPSAYQAYFAFLGALPIQWGSSRLASETYRRWMYNSAVIPYADKVDNETLDFLTNQFGYELDNHADPIGAIEHMYPKVSSYWGAEFLYWMFTLRSSGVSGPDSFPTAFYFRYRIIFDDGFFNTYDIPYSYQNFDDPGNIWNPLKGTGGITYAEVSLRVIEAFTGLTIQDIETTANSVIRTWEVQLLVDNPLNGALFQVSRRVRYYVDPATCCGDYRTCVYFRNYWGQYDRIHFQDVFTVTNERNEVTYQTGIGNRLLDSPFVGTTRTADQNTVFKYTLRTPPLNQAHYLWLHELMTSTDIYLYSNVFTNLAPGVINNPYQPVVIDTFNWSFNSEEDVYTLEIVLQTSAQINAITA